MVIRGALSHKVMYRHHIWLTQSVGSIIYMYYLNRWNNGLTIYGHQLCPEPQGNVLSPYHADLVYALYPLPVPVSTENQKQELSEDIQVHRAATKFIKGTNTYFPPLWAPKSIDVILES